MDTPHVLSRDDILRAEVDEHGQPMLPTETVEVPEWGGSVIVRGLSGTGRDTFEASLVLQRGKKQEANLANFRAKLLAHSLVDEAGRLLFTAADVPMLGRKSAIALERVYEVAQRLSRLSPDDVDELTAELGNDQSDGSGSDSQDTSDTDPSLTLNDTSAQPSLLNG